MRVRHQVLHRHRPGQAGRELPGQQVPVLSGHRRQGAARAGFRLRWPDFHALLPVSYTHLDVYKRQAHLRACLRGAARRRRDRGCGRAADPDRVPRRVIGPVHPAHAAQPVRTGRVHVAARRAAGVARAVPGRVVGVALQQRIARAVAHLGQPIQPVVGILSLIHI